MALFWYCPPMRCQAAGVPVECDGAIGRTLPERLRGRGSSIMLASQVLDTRFRAALARMADASRIVTCTREADPHLEIAALMKKLDGGPALLFPTVRGYGVPVIGNLLSCPGNW